MTSAAQLRRADQSGAGPRYGSRRQISSGRPVPAASSDAPGEARSAAGSPSDLVDGLAAGGKVAPRAVLHRPQQRARRPQASHHLKAAQRGCARAACRAHAQQPRSASNCWECRHGVSAVSDVAARPGDATGRRRACCQSQAACGSAERASTQLCPRTLQGLLQRRC